MYGNLKSNYHTIMTTTAHQSDRLVSLI